jgi:hypothetical protein
MEWFSRKALRRTVPGEGENGAPDSNTLGSVWPMTTILVLVYGRT